MSIGKSEPLHGDIFGKVKLQGLDPDRIYTVEEINLMPGKKSTTKENGKSYSGDYLMKVGLDAFTEHVMNSKVIRLK